MAELNLYPTHNLHKEPLKSYEKPFHRNVLQPGETCSACNLKWPASWSPSGWKEMLIVVPAFIPLLIYGLSRSNHKYICNACGSPHR